MRSKFIAAANKQGWTPATQIAVLLDLLEQHCPPASIDQFLTPLVAEEEASSGNDGVTIPAIAGFIHTDDHLYKAEFDARLWFEQASDEAILATARAEFSAAHDTDEIALFFENKSGFDAVTNLFEYLSHHPRMGNGDTVGFSCEIDPVDVFAWLEKNRPYLLEKAVAFRIHGVKEPLAKRNGRPSEILRITSEGTPFVVRIIRKDDHYGLQGRLIYKSSEPMVEFYDARFDNEKFDLGFGQFISRYNAATLTGADGKLPLRGHGAGLLLDSGSPQWRITGPVMEEVTAWIISRTAVAV